MLELSGVSASYGSVPAISNVSIAIGEGAADDAQVVLWRIFDDQARGMVVGKFLPERLPLLAAGFAVVVAGVADAGGAAGADAG